MRITLFTIFLSVQLFANAVVLTDTTIIPIVTDTAGTTVKTDTATVWCPNPTQAVWMAAVVPGLGQIYNRSYWKLPIVYGGFMGCAYAIIWNGGLYNDYKTAYRDILLDSQLSDDPTRSYNAILPKGYTIETMGGRSQYTATLKDRQSLYRRYRDISIVAAVAVYILSIIDAYVDAQLFDFDISPDLTLNVEPQINYDLRKQRSTELKVAINF